MNNKESHTRVILKGGEFEFAAQNLVQPQAAGGLQAVAQVDAAITRALDEPIDFPPICQAFIPGDLVAIAVNGRGESTSQAIETMVSFLLNHEVEESQIRVVFAQPNNQPLKTDLSSEVHSAKDSQRLAYLGAGSDEAPIYVNRSLVDADLVIPIGLVDGLSPSDTICPSFCDEQTTLRIGRMPRETQESMINAINDYLGVFWTIQIVAGPGASVHQVLIGRRDSVARKIEATCRQVWQQRVDEPMGLVVVTIESETEQTWENACRAIVCADQVVAESGAIVLCCSLGHRPDTWFEDRPGNSQDELHEIFLRRHVYLISELSQDDSEELGFGHIQSSRELQRLAGQFPTSLVLRDAHKLQLATCSNESSQIG